MIEATSCMNEDCVVEPSETFWSKEDDRETCYLFLQWDGLGQRQAWFQNCVANAYRTIGHLVHTLGLACPEVRSTTVIMHEVNHYKYVAETVKEKGVTTRLNEVESSDDEYDIGF
jgi:hypothetical protein